MKPRINLKSILLYGGLEKDEYDRCLPEISESDRKVLIIGAIVLFAISLPLAIYGFTHSGFEAHRFLYLGLCVMCVLIGSLALTLCKGWPKLTAFCVYLSLIGALSFGILSGTVCSDGSVSGAVFTALLFAAPLLFNERPLGILILVPTSVITFVVLSKIYIDSAYHADLILNAVCFGVLSLVLSPYIAVVKFKRFALEERNKNLSEVDQLTGLYNRRKAEMRMTSLSTSSAPLLTILMDVDGLKKTNDTIGHSAGDELIRGAAECIKDVFGPYGSCYRMGGDEFLVLIENLPLDPKELKARLAERTSAWHGNAVPSLSIAIGIVRSPASAVADSLIRADALMYQDKKEHYGTCGDETN